MRLVDLLKNIDTVNDDQIIYAELVNDEWLLESQCVLVPIPEDEDVEQLPQDENMEYLMEVFLAKGLIRDCKMALNRITLEPDEKLREIVYYRIHDAPLPL